VESGNERDSDLGGFPDTRKWQAQEQRTKSKEGPYEIAITKRKPDKVPSERERSRGTGQEKNLIGKRKLLAEKTKKPQIFFQGTKTSKHTKKK